MPSTGEGKNPPKVERRHTGGLPVAQDATQGPPHRHTPAARDERDGPVGDRANDREDQDPQSTGR